MDPRHQAPPSSLLGSSYQVEKKLAVAVVVADPECLDVTVNQDVLLNRKAVLYKVRRPERSYRTLAAVPLVLCTVSGKPQLLLALLSPSYQVFECLWILGQIWISPYFSLSSTSDYNQGQKSLL